MATAKRRDRKPYRPPRLKVHGDLRALTHTAKGGIRSDGGGAPKTRASTPA
jgi:hypothetical protein